jgi:hypothetical protein
MQPATRHLDRFFVVILAALYLCFLATAVFSRPDKSDTILEPYFPPGFDRDAWVRELNACCDVYVGREEFLREPVVRQAPADPFFSDASIERLEFRGEPIIVARQRARLSTGVR